MHAEEEAKRSQEHEANKVENEALRKLKEENMMQVEQLINNHTYILTSQMSSLVPPTHG